MSLLKPSPGSPPYSEDYQSPHNTMIYEAPRVPITHDLTFYYCLSLYSHPATFLFFKHVWHFHTLASMLWQFPGRLFPQIFTSFKPWHQCQGDIVSLTSPPLTILFTIVICPALMILIPLVLICLFFYAVALTVS